MGKVSSLAELPDAVRQAISRLRRTSQEPILILVPRERRVIKAIVGGSASGLPNRGELGDHHLGEWEGCQVAQKPYLDPSSIVVMAPLAFYGEVDEDAASRLALRIDHPHKQEHDNWVQEAQSETDPAKIHETGEVTVAAIAQFAPCVGVNDHRAVLRIELDLSQVGYALVGEQDVYHRPDCTSLSETDGEVAFTLDCCLSGDKEARTPCEHCRPDDWEEQAEHEVQDAIAAE